jgi:hypothetical protein
MAIPSLDSVVAGYINLPLRIQYAKWLAGVVDEDFSEYATYPERYLLAKIAVGVGAPKDEAAYISPPSEYVYKAIYDALTETEDGEVDWDEKEALGRIAAAYNQSTASDEIAWFVSLPKKYQLGLIVAFANSDEPEPEPETFNAVIVAGAGTTGANGTYQQVAGEVNGRQWYEVVPGADGVAIAWSGDWWGIYGPSPSFALYYFDAEGLDVEFPWEAGTWAADTGASPPPTLTPTNV